MTAATQAQTDTAAVTPTKGNELPDIQTLPFHPVVERLSEIMAAKAQNTDKQFFRIAVSYYMAVMASNMRVNVRTPDRGVIPVNAYVIGLAPSGSGKGLCTTTIEESVIADFTETFINNTMEVAGEMQFNKLALSRAARKGTDPDDEMERVKKEWDRLGPMLFSFDGGTAAAIRQVRHKLLMAKAGAVSAQIDEIGENLTRNTEIMPLYLELYDKGRLKQKLVKNTDENIRSEDLGGVTPANMLMFGTPTRVFNGSKTEEEFFAFLDAGYARRSFFAYVTKHRRKIITDVDEVIKRLKANKSDEVFTDLNSRFGKLADISNLHKEYVLNMDVFRQLMQYKIDCEVRADKLPDHAEMRRAELAHRYFKVLKMAGAYAFVDDSPELEAKHLHYAIRLAEESGKAFEDILNRDRAHVRLAKYLAGIPANAAVTHADLVEDLPFYPSAQGKRNEMLQLATAYGYRNNILIKKSFDQGIEFLHGESLEESSLDRMYLSYSNDIAEGYQFVEAPWNRIHELTQAPNLHWINHATDNGHRSEDHIVPGFNMLVFDIDGTAKLDEVRKLLADYTYHIYTTKRHGQDGKDRFRLMLPINYILKMDREDFTTMMKGVAEWLPFEVDAQTFQRSRKWLTNTGQYFTNEGRVFDILPFIPRTERDEERKKRLAEYGGNLDNLERWVLDNSGSGNRNNQLLKYALVLLDLGHNFEQIRQKVISLNDKMPDKLSETEITSTILVTVARRLNNQP